MKARLLRFVLLVVFSGSVLLNSVFSTSPLWAAPTAEQKQELAAVTTLMTKAGGLFGTRRY
jgi:hypothetical protein